MSEVKTIWQELYERRKGKIKTFIMTLNVVTDKEIIEQLDFQTNKAGYIKELIRQDIARKKG